MAAYPRLFSEWKIRNTTIKNRVVFPPTCPSWVSDPWNGLFIDMATHYYRERAEGGVGLIIIGGTHVHRSSLMAPLLMPQLFDDRQIEPLSKIADAVHAEGCKLAIQLWHSGVRGFPTFKQEATYDPDETWYSVSPSQVPLGEFPGASTPKELDEDEIEELLEAFGSAAVARVRGGARRGRAPSESRLPALAVHLAALQQAHRPLGRLPGEPPALPARGVEADARRRRRRQVRRLPHQLDLVLAGRSRNRRGARHRRRDREAGGHRLRQRLGRRASRLHPHADGVRGRLGARLRPQDSRDFVEAGAAGWPHHHAGRGRAPA